MDPATLETLGTSAVLLAILIALGKFTQAFITRALADKDKQIEQLSGTVDDLTTGIAATLTDVLNAIKEQASDAEERRRGR